ncbi:MAG TPA: MFS transporter [Bryobacteraceae bacterium]|nr:MFS transporter [Bryobacteraceae bacterium]
MALLGSLSRDFSSVKAPRIRWFFIGLAFAATVVNYLDRQTLSVVEPVLREKLHFGDIAYSRIVFAFMLAYTISNGISGPFIDRLGTRLGYALSMFWWSTASVLHVFARSAWGLGACRFLLGMGEAGNWPAAVKVVSEWFPAGERAFACGLFNSGSSIGAIAAPPLVAWIVLKFGWPPAFLVTGFTGFIWLAVWLGTYSSPRATQPLKEPPPSAWSLLRQRFVWSLTLGKIFFDPVWYFYIFWFPQYLASARHFDLKHIGFYAWIPFLSADLGNLAGGGFSAVLLRRGVPLVAARQTAIWVFCGLMMSAIPAVLAPDARWSIAFVSLATLGYTGALANMLALPGDFYPANAVGSIWGLASMGAGFGGMLFTLITGELVARFSYTPVFIGFGLLPLIAAAIIGWVTCAARPETVLIKY